MPISSDKPVAAEHAVRTVALIGNPNTGKSTLFGALVGVRQHVGNYPGVTVEKKTGRMETGGHRFEVIDLPGLYSLAPRSRDEMVAADVLLGRCGDFGAIDAVICLVDAGNLERNLYLVSQVLEFGLPTVVAVNMLDVAKRRSIEVDLDRLDSQLPAPVVGIQANRGVGVAELKRALAAVLDRPVPAVESPFPEAFEAEISRLESLPVCASDGPAGKNVPKCLLRRLLVSGDEHLQKTLSPNGDTSLADAIAAARGRLAAADCAVPAVETKARYGWVARVLKGVVAQAARGRPTATDRIDRILTHRIFGTLIFAAIMVGVFQAIFRGALPLMGLLDEGIFGPLAGWVEATMAEGALRSLMVDGVIGGVGGVATFLPQILILFLFIAVLEDCGYMARAAYLMDKLMSRVGLSGKSFIPMVSSFACAVPGIMATRVIENERDRLTTILVAPLMSCSARLPVYVLLIAAFIPSQTYFGGLIGLQAVTCVAMYVLGIVTAVAVSLLLKRTVLRGDTPPFLMELPSYKWPSIRTVVTRVSMRGWVFVRTAGTLILAVSILVWAAMYYPHDTAAIEALPEVQDLQTQIDACPAETPERGELTAARDRLVAGRQQQQSILGHMGQWIEPAVRPLGWDWRIGCAVIASFPAREVVVATLGVIYNLGEDVDLESEADAGEFHRRLSAATWDGSDPPRPVFTVPVALSIMVFFALCAQCAATLAVIKRETNSWRWPAFTFAYMTVLAYLGALATYQIGTWMG